MVISESEFTDELLASIDRVAWSITAPATPGTDETGGSIASLTEAVMGITAGLCRIAEAMQEVAAAIRNRKQTTTGSIDMSKGI